MQSDMRKTKVQLINELQELREQSEETVASSEHRYQVLMENMADAFSIVGVDGTLLYFSDSLPRVMGYSPEERLGRHVLDNVHPDDVPIVMVHYEQILQAPGSKVQFEARALHKDGSWRWLEVDCKNLLGDPAVQGILVAYRDITERSHMEEALRESEEKYRKLVENSRDSIVLVDFDGYVRFANDAAVQLTGYSLEEGIGMNITEFVPPDYLGEAQTKLLEAQGGVRVPYFNSVLKRKDSTVVPVEIGGQAVIQDGEAVGAQVIIRDITEREQAEEKNKTIIKTALDGFWLSDLEGRLLEVNDSYCQMIGYTREELLTMSISDIEAIEKPKETARHIRRVVKQGSDFFETRQRCKDGRIIDVEVSVNHLDVEGGRQFVFVRDITERKQTENLLRDILNNSPVSVYIFDGNKLRLVNPTFQQNTGYTEEELLTMNPSELVHPDDREFVEKKMIERLEGKLTEPFEFRGVNKDGSVQWVLMSVAPIQYQGKPAMLATPLNITERKQSEEALRTAEENYRNSMGDSPLGIRIINAKGETLYANKAILGLYGYASLEELIATPAKRRHTPESYAAYMKRRERRMAGKRVPSTFEVSIIRDDSEVRVLQVFQKTVMWAGQECFQIVSQDITERRRAEEALRESEDRYRNLVELAPDAIISVDENGIVTSCNQAFARQSGYDTREIIGKYFTELPTMVSPDSKAAYDKMFASLSSNGKLKPFEFPWTHKDGTLRWGEAHAVVMMENGQFIGVQAILRDVTERKKAGEALRESEEKLNRIFDSVTDGITVTDLNGVITDVNKAILRLGRFDSESDVVGTSAFESIVPSDRERALADMQALVQQEAVGSGEYTLLRADGSEYPAEISANVLKDAAGNLVGFVSVIRDITERKQAEEIFQTVSMRSPAGMYVVQDGRFVFANPQFLRDVGFAEDELLGTKSLALVHPEDRDSVRRNAVEMLKSTRTAPYEFRAVNRHGAIRWLMETVVPIQYRGKQAVLGNIVDITEQKQSRERLQQSRRRFRDLVNLLPQGVYEIDTEYKITFANRWAIEASGHTLEEVNAAPLNALDVVIPEDRERMRKNIQRIMNGEKLSGVEYTHVSKDGSTMPIITYSVPIVQDGKTVGLRGVTVDITERKQAEEERQRIEKLESLGTLAGGIAHDFNNLLTGIMGNISLARRYVEAESKANERLVEAEKASMRARDLTQQLLTFSKGGAPVKKIISIGQLVEESANFALRGSSVRGVFTLPDDLWAVNVDEGQMSEVISNLVINADEAMPEGGTINISAKNITLRGGKVLPLPKGDYVEVIIEDHGVGIRKEHLGRIFEPYFTTKQKGSGLGLATAYSIVKNHDGNITVESKLGAGSTFRVYLPASKEPVRLEREESDEPSIPGRGRILVMDDEEAIRQLIERALADVGYEISLAADGEEAVEQYTRAKEAGRPFDAVILDLTVPGRMGGREAVQKLLEIDPDVRAIASSGYSTDPVIAEFKKHGFRGVVVKPYRVLELRETLHNVLKEPSK